MRFLNASLIFVAFVSAPAFAATPYYAEGKFGHALNSQFGTLAAAYRPGYAQPPFTVECWVKLRRCPPAQHPCFKRDKRILDALGNIHVLNQWPLQRSSARLYAGTDR